ncbi:hypothetical protein ACWHLZ_37510 [Streptomyces chartreusis]|uniref:hypothetical protein n=1 Tax=Streptomyces sp. JL3001 TaxID=3400923 RepID=UPI003B2882C4
MKRILASLGAAAADGCWGNAGQKKGPGGGTYTARYCHNWFVCQQKFDLENPPVGSARNNWWLWTQGDVAYADNGWGWESIAGLQNC